MGKPVLELPIRACQETRRHESHVYYRGRAEIPITETGAPHSHAFDAYACPGVNPHLPATRDMFAGPVYAWFGGPTWKAYVWHGKRARKMKRDRKRSGYAPGVQERKHWELRAKLRQRLMDGGLL